MLTLLKKINIQLLEVTKTADFSNKTGCKMRDGKRTDFLIAWKLQNVLEIDLDLTYMSDQAPVQVLEYVQGA